MMLDKWLQNPADVIAGINLYAEHGTDPILFYALQIDPNELLVQRMVTDLTSVLQAGNGKRTEPEAVKQAREQWRAKYKRCSHLHAQLRHLATDGERLQHAMEILSTMDEVEQLWDLIDTWEATGQLPKPAKSPEAVRTFEGWDQARLIKEKLLVASYISNQKKKISTGAKSAKQLQEWQAKLEHKLAEYETLKKLTA
ncbi:MAG: hypothetical protein KDB85_12640 [Chitinophagales bacterium]|nr:hypothetical protein [Chitinophagales bacterium]